MTPTALLIILATVAIVVSIAAYSAHVKSGSVPAFILACAFAAAGLIMVAVGTVYSLAGVTF